MMWSLSRSRRLGEQSKAPGSKVVCPRVLDVAAEEVTIGSKPGDFCGDDGAAGEDGADLIAHGSAASHTWLKFSPMT